MQEAEIIEEKVSKPKLKTGRKTLTKNQEKFCKLIATEAVEPLDAMLQVYPTRRSYAQFNQNRLLRELQNNPRVIKRLEELFLTVRDNEVLGDMYNFDKGVRLLTDQIERANEAIESGKFGESLHRIILTSVQELNRMYGYNIVDRHGNTGGTVNVTFIDVNKPNEEKEGEK